MIITRTPHRVSFTGGGTDLPDFYQQYGGAVVSVAIDKYVYISSNRPHFFDKTVVKYNDYEEVQNIDDIKHRIFKAVLQELNEKNIEINSNSDIPGGTGLGSSSSFTVGLLQNLLSYTEEINCNKHTLADYACEIEINTLGNPIGKQDQYAATFGGLNYIEFLPDEKVIVQPVKISQENFYKLNNNLLLFYTGTRRDANKLLAKQKADIDNRAGFLQLMAKMAKNTKDALEQGDFDKFNELINDNWNLKRKLADGITNDFIENINKVALDNGAKSCKLNGAGSSGFIMCYCEPENQLTLKSVLKREGIVEMPFGFDMFGTKVIYNSNYNEIFKGIH